MGTASTERQPRPIGGDSVQPGPEACWLTELREPQAGGQGCILGDVLRLGARAEEPLAEAQQTRVGARDKRTQR